MKKKKLEMFTVNQDFDCYDDYLKNSEKLKSIPLNDIETLAKNINVHFTPEIFVQNDFYYNALNLKKYAGLSDKFLIKATMEHAIGYHSYVNENDIKAPFNDVIVASKYREELFQQKNISKHIIKIGPIIAYAKSILAEYELNFEKARLGKNAIVFPCHSTHFVSAKFNVNEFIEQLKFETKDFDSVRICLYWKNILDGDAKPYLKAGFECVTCGHMFDPWFLPRHRALIEIADLTISNDFTSSSLGNSLALNTPHFLMYNECHYSGSELTNKEEKNKIKNSMDTEKSILKSSGIQKEFYKLFSKKTDKITEEQRKFANYYFGLDEFKTPDEMKFILLNLDKKYEDNLLIDMDTSREQLNNLFEIKHVNYNENSRMNDYGKEFTYNNKVYIGVKEEYKYDALNFLTSALYKKLVKLKYFPKLKMADIKIEGFSFLLERENIQNSQPSEWSFSMIKDVAKFLLELNNICLENGYYLKDGELNNVLFKGTKPIFTNISSFVKNNNNISEKFSIDMKETVLMPLVLYTMGEKYLAHALLASEMNIVDKLKPETNFYQSKIIEKVFEKFLFKKMKINPIKIFSKKNKIEYALNKMIKSETIDNFIDTHSVNMEFNPDLRKFKKISEIIKENSLETDSFCCLGGGLGELPLFLEKTNLHLKRVINIDYNEEKIENSYSLINQNQVNSNVGTYLMNFMCPKREKVYEDFQSNIVYVSCIEILLNQGFLPEDIMSSIKKFTNKYIYVELENEKFLEIIDTSKIIFNEEISKGKRIVIFKI